MVRPSQRHGLQVGAEAPDVDLLCSDGRTLSLRQLATVPLVVMFTASDCSPCQRLLDALTKVVVLPHKIQLIIVHRGSSEVSSHCADLPSGSILSTQSNWEISRLFELFATPASYIIGIDYKIQHGPTLGPDAILQQLEDLIMRERLVERLETLEEEMRRGQIECDDLNRRRRYLEDAMARINGAIQVLKELLDDSDHLVPVKAQNHLNGMASSHAHEIASDFTAQATNTGE